MVKSPFLGSRVNLQLVQISTPRNLRYNIWYNKWVFLLLLFALNYPQKKIKFNIKGLIELIQLTLTGFQFFDMYLKLGYWLSDTAAFEVS
jgi:hypothetical protein